MKIYLLLILIFVNSCSTYNELRDKTNNENGKDQIDKPTVLLISIDGYRFDYTKKYNPPNITKFISDGTSSKGIIPIYPSKTFPNHYAIATGMYAENHGLVSNDFYSPTRKQFYSLRNRKTVQDGTWYKGIPLWILAEQNQMLSASYFFVGSDANIMGMHPHYYYNYNQSTPNSERVDTVIKWLNKDKFKRPHFLTLYFSDVDSAGHHYGPNSLETKEAVLNVDKALGELFKKIKNVKAKNINIIIVSDHGMEEVIAPKYFQYLSDFIDIQKNIVTSSGSHLNVYIKNKKNINKVYKKLKNLKHANVFLKKNVPVDYHYKKSNVIGDIIISAKNHYYILKKRRASDLIKNKYRKGTHGYEPKLTPNMKGIFYAKGSQIKSVGEIKSFENIHVYPFIAEILKLKIHHKIDGKLDTLKFLLK